MGVIESSNVDGISYLDSNTLTKLKKEATCATHFRSRLCLHQNLISPVQEMINVFCSECYLRPHRHPVGKTESYHLIEGTLRIYLFDDHGLVTSQIDLRCGDKQFPFFFHQQGGIWHMPVAITPFVVFHEVYMGPFEKDIDVEFAPWSPEYDDFVAIKQFMAAIK
ncbi:cupin fold metalloprotein, WbuC family [Ectothiorhodospiraceae bacterium BW-2]|nr:cupin fold metalloprotein, WbuC family [Ectothiorhodospiraceae bacterium BW-2]